MVGLFHSTLGGVDERSWPNRARFCEACVSGAQRGCAWPAVLRKPRRRGQVLEVLSRQPLTKIVAGRFVASTEMLPAVTFRHDALVLRESIMKTTTTHPMHMEIVYAVH
jgi:hypothetical protein